MQSSSTALPAAPAFSTILDIRGLQPSSVLCKLSENLGPSDQVNVYGTLDSTATSSSANIVLLGSVYGNQGDTANPLTIGLWPFLFAQRVAGTATGTFFVSGSTASGTTTAPSSTALPSLNAFSTAINLTSFGSGLPVRVGLDKSATANDVFNVYGTNDSAFVGTAGGQLINQISGGGKSSSGSVLVQNFQYVYVQRVAGSTAGNLLAWGADDVAGATPGSYWAVGGNTGASSPFVGGTNDATPVHVVSGSGGTSGAELDLLPVSGTSTTVTAKLSTPNAVLISAGNALAATTSSIQLSPSHSAIPPNANITAGQTFLSPPSGATASPTLVFFDEAGSTSVTLRAATTGNDGSAYTLPTTAPTNSVGQALVSSPSGAMSFGSSIQKGSNALTAGVSGAIAANISATSRIVVSLKTPVSDALTVKYSALGSGRTNGTPGSFVISALNATGGGAVNTNDTSTIDWVVLDN